MALGLLVACERSAQPSTIVIVATPSATPWVLPTQPAATPTPSPTPLPSPTPAGWEAIGDGVQIRHMAAYEGGRGGDVFALRLNPARVDIRLRYDPEQPRDVAEWFAAERPLAALNAAFFDQDFTPVGLWMIDDTTFGRGHYRMQGEFRVTGAGLSIRRINERHLSDGTRIFASLESYPFLLLPGGVINPCLLDPSFRVGRRYRLCANIWDPAERLVVGLDRAGYLMFLLAPYETFSLAGLGEWLYQSDLNLDVALNLDGGSSAGMLVQTGERTWGADSGRKVPGALVVLPKVLGIGDNELP